MKNNYYKLLGIDELTSKPLIKIAYLIALENAIQTKKEETELKEIQLAYQLLRNYKNRLLLISKNEEKIKARIEEIKSKIGNEKIEIKNVNQKKTLEIKYIIRTLFTGIFGFLFYLISETLGDLLTLTVDIRNFLASVLFYFSILNLWVNWFESFYSLIIILTSIGLVLWHLKSFERQVKKNCG